MKMQAGRVMGVLALAGMLAAGAQTRKMAKPVAKPAPKPAVKSAANNPTVAELSTRVHAFLERTLGWQGLDGMEVESISGPDASGLRTAKVVLSKGDQHQEATYFITADGREIVEGQKSTLSADPWAATRAKLDTRGAPAEGAAEAPVTIVEFSDLECPYCKEEAGAIKQLMQDDPGKVRVIFKYYPLTKIHPWSMQAAVAAVCVARQHPAQFWNFADTVFADQDQINPANAAQRLQGIAEESEAESGAYTACIASPAARKVVVDSIANGNAMGVQSTPTLFIDGRMVPGAVQESELKLLVDFEAKFRQPPSSALASRSPSGPQCGGGCTPLPPLPKK